MGDVDMAGFWWGCVAYVLASDPWLAHVGYCAIHISQAVFIGKPLHRGKVPSMAYNHLIHSAIVVGKP